MAENPYAAPSSNVAGGESYSSAGNVAASTVNILRSTKGWARFLSVLLFIAGGFMIIVALLLLAKGGSLPPELTRELGREFGGSIAFLALIYLAGALIAYIIPAIILGGYASRIGTLITNPVTVTLDAALDKQRGFFKYLGILAIIGIGFFVLAFLYGISMASRLN